MKITGRFIITTNHKIHSLGTEGESCMRLKNYPSTFHTHPHSHYNAIYAENK